MKLACCGFDEPHPKMKHLRCAYCNECCPVSHARKIFCCVKCKTTNFEKDDGTVTLEEPPGYRPNQ